MSSSLSGLLKNAIAAHQAGRFDDAYSAYLKVLEQRPTEPTALYMLGLLSFHRGDADAAARHISHSLEHAPRNARAWKDLGGILFASERLEEAARAYRRAVEVGPELAENWYNLGICVRRCGDLTGAISHLKQAIRLDPAYVRAYEPLATLLYEHGEPDTARQVYRQWLLHDPDSPKARHMAAAAAGESAPARASDEYIRAHFDGAARSFDSVLGNLKYRAPELVAAALSRLLSSPVETVLDAGCGTGLLGPLVRPCCRTLIGIDLSPGMLTQAALRGSYDELLEAELTSYLCSHPAELDAIVCADTLVYFGELEEPLRAARGALKGAGPLVFTLEAVSDEADYQLEIHGRYRHGEAYLRRILPAVGLTVQSLTREILREERLAPVVGHLVIARRA
jgi:predicted TPR repeat methyltransferase